MRELIVDNFAGAGGASVGIEMALGRAVDIAINHSAKAIETHAHNHPETLHLCEDVFDVDPVEVCAGRSVGLAWFSPDCKHFSKAKGGKPRDKKIRGLAWVAIKWAAAVRPRVIILENVEEFRKWGPLDKTGRPIKAREGETFERWCSQLEALGYVIDWRELSACDYGTPTTRKRFFLVARRDGQPIVWPDPTHGPGLEPYRTAAECIDWSLPCPSIFERKRPLVENTMRRIAMGIQRYVIEAAEPFIVKCNHQGSGFRGQDIKEPLRTVMASSRGHHALVTPMICGIDNKSNGAGSVWDGKAPLRTITTENRFTLTTAFLTKFYGTNTGQDVRQPMPTVTAGGNHIGEVRAFLIKYYGQGCGQGLHESMHTVTTKDRLGLVTVAGVDYQIVDIGLRMLQPHELAAAQGFPSSYEFLGTKTTKVAHIGNSVCPPIAAALVQVNCADMALEKGAVA